MDDHPPRGCRQLLLSLLVITGAICLCIGATTLGIDGMCVASIEPRLPVYPGATAITQRHTFLRQFGMGVTVITLYSPDDDVTVTSWYARTIGTVIQDNLNKGVSRSLGSAEWSVVKAEDGTGSQIVLYSKCGT